MKKAKKLLSVLKVALTLLVLSGCSTTVKFIYTAQKTPLNEERVTVNSLIFLSVADLREEPGFIGYLDNAYGPITKVMTNPKDITGSIYARYKEELTKKGFVFTDDYNNCDFRLIFSVTEFYAEIYSNLLTQAESCIKVTLKFAKENSELFTADVCGKGEKKAILILDKDDIPLTLSMATDEALNKILGETALIAWINGNIK